MAGAGVDAVARRSPPAACSTPPGPTRRPPTRPDLRPAPGRRRPGRRSRAPPLHPLPGGARRTSCPPTTSTPALGPRPTPARRRWPRRCSTCSAAASGRLAVDDLHDADVARRFPRRAGGASSWSTPAPLFTAARLHKTPDEVECLRRSWRDERGGDPGGRGARPARRPPVGAERGLPVGAVRAGRDAPTSSTRSSSPCPTASPTGPGAPTATSPSTWCTTDHVLSEGEVIWTDTVSGYEGYASDVGRTWVVGPASSPVRDELHERWEAITAAVLDRAPARASPPTCSPGWPPRSTAATKPWLDHFFLGHTLGLEGGEMQHIGSDKGQAYDEQLVLEPGMAVVIEPVTWADGPRRLALRGAGAWSPTTATSASAPTPRSRVAMSGTVGRAGRWRSRTAPGVDFAALRADRRSGCWPPWPSGGIDLLLLGRQGNARYVVGHRPIWRAVVTAWAPFCALRADGGVHLLHTTWDDGVPEEIPHEHLSGLSLEPADHRGRHRRHPRPGRRDRSSAVDGMSPGLAMLLGHLAPEAELVDGEALLRAVRAVKLPGRGRVHPHGRGADRGRADAPPLADRSRASSRPGSRARSTRPWVATASATPPAEGRFGTRAATSLRPSGDLVTSSAGGALAFAGYEGAVAPHAAVASRPGHGRLSSAGQPRRGRRALPGGRHADRAGSTRGRVRRAAADAAGQGTGLGVEAP